MSRRILQGVVVSAKNTSTVIVKVYTTVRHPLYKKVIRKFKKYSVHDEKCIVKEGEYVSIMESRPISKNKRFVLVY